MRNRDGFYWAALLGLAAWSLCCRTAPAHAAEVRTVRPTVQRMVESVLATGVIRPKQGASVQLTPQIAGRVEQVLVDVGDPVKAGQLLLRLEEAPLAAARAEAAAALAVAQAEWELADSEARRYQAAPQVFSAEQVTRQTLQAQVKAQTVAQRQAALDRAQINWGYRELRAPQAGTVSAVRIQPGELVGYGDRSESVVALIDLKALEILAYVDETDVGRIQIGQAAKFNLDTYLGQDFGATIRQIDPQPEIQNGVVNYVVSLDFQVPDGVVIRPEMTAHVQIEISAHETLTLPRRCLIRDGTQTFVRVREGPQMALRPVQLGVRNENTVEVLTGVSSNDEIEIHNGGSL
ncbi:MAG: efflux RND transporter periplasmic adaptor subunit [Acidobacteria bacterium]|nr:efflux RND transporter periplasmic adaptor subunit [Acidobacteriota bacterium]